VSKLDRVRRCGCFRPDELAGLTANPDGPWTAQQARNVLLWPLERDRPLEFLVRDDDSNSKSAFDTIFNGAL